MPDDLDVVSAAYIVNDDRLLLILHKQIQKWLPVGGHREPNETLCEAARREIREEVGLEIDFLQYPTPRQGNQRQYPLPFYTDKHPINPTHSHSCFFLFSKSKIYRCKN